MLLLRDWPPAPRLLRGIPDQIAAAADGLQFRHRYTSGVIACGTCTTSSKAARREGRKFRPDRESITALLTEAIKDGLVPRRAGRRRHLIAGIRCSEG